MKLANGLITAMISLLFLGCHEEEDTMPDHLLGSWKTRAAEYEGRTLEFTKDHIVFRIGAEQVDTNLIKAIQTVRTGDQVSYTITYKDLEGFEHKISFTYDSSSHDEELRIQNQRRVTWTKAKH